MKTLERISWLAVVAVGTATAFSAGVAEANEERGHCALHAEHRAEMLQRFDANHDGTLDSQERQQMRQARIARFDRDGDGKLNKDERRQAQKAMAERIFSRLDGNSDGQLTKDEVAASCAKMARHFDRVDANADGVVTKAEFSAKFKKHARCGRHDHHGRREGHRSDGSHGPRPRSQ